MSYTTVDASEDNNSLLPEILVDDHILKNYTNHVVTHSKNSKDSKVYYEINGTLFSENDLNDREMILPFEVIGMEIKIQNDDIQFDGDTETGTIIGSTMPEADDTYLSVILQETPYGIIINSNILLTVKNWNTLMDQENELKCVVCDNVFDNIEEHLETDIHKENMDKYQPLKKFDLNITRLIGDNYHCGVCNEVFERNKDNDHFDSKDHEEKMLFASNRASDVIYDFDIHSVNGNTKDVNKNKDSYQFDRNRINSVGDSSDIDNECADGFYDYEFDANNNDNIRIPTPENVQLINKEFSYASIAKNTAATPEFLDVFLFEQNLKIKFDSWHMVVTTKSNQFYCMVCKVFYHITQKAKHCSEDRHMFKLGQCRFLKSYKENFIRQVNGKYYHCGLCNSLQVRFDIDDHINKHVKKPNPALQDESISTKNKKNENIKYNDPRNRNNINIPHEVTEVNVVNTKETKNANKKRNTGDSQINESQFNATNIVKNKANENGNTKTVPEQCERINERQINNETPGVLNDIIVNQFGYNLRVSFMSYNIVCDRGNDYYCGVCNFISSEHMMNQHINTNFHVEILRQISFEYYYGVNLIRRVGYNSHCTICNVLVAVDFTVAHINDPKHIALLNEALGMTRNNKQAEIRKEGPTDVKRLKQKKKNNTKATDTHVKNLDATDKEINFPENKIDQHEEIKENIVEEKFELNGGDELVDTDDHENYAEDNECFNETFVYLKIKNTFAKVSVLSYNSLVNIGDGTKYCFVCSKRVFCSPRRHINSQNHSKSMKDCKFLIEYDKHLLRQMLLVYHCAICNVLFSKKDLNHHINWQLHSYDHKIDKKSRKKDLKGGSKQFVVSYQEEAEFPDAEEPVIKILDKIEIKKNSQTVEDVHKRNKIVMCGERALKISWDGWHSLCKDKSGYKCLLCQQLVKCYELSTHISDESHTKSLEIFEREYLPALVRKVNEAILHCVICNVEVSNKAHIISEHLNGKKHKKTYTILTDVVSKYTDCKDDILYL